VFDYPADMSRGIDVPAPVVRVWRPEPASPLVHRSLLCAGSDHVVAAGQNMLVQLPIPDASMPFNVACFTSTLLSLLFGATMPILLWERDELSEFQTARRSIKARLRRIVLALLVAGAGLAYLDLSSRAMLIDAVSEVQRMLRVSS